MCPACGRPCPIGVCAGPHPDYRLRGTFGGPKAYVELPEWWAVVTETPLPWRVRYDPAAELRARQQAERDESARMQAMKQRGDELRELLRLANKLGFDVRAKVPAWELQPA